MSALASLAMAGALQALAAHEHETAPSWCPDVQADLAFVGVTEPAPWCAAFAVHRIGEAAARLDVPFPFGEPAGLGAVQALFERARSKGLLVPADRAAFGDLVCYAFGPDMGHHDRLGLLFHPVILSAGGSTLTVASIDADDGPPSSVTLRRRTLQAGRIHTIRYG